MRLARRLALAAALLTPAATPAIARADVFSDRRDVFVGPVYITHYATSCGTAFCLRAVVEQGVSRSTGSPFIRGYLVDVSSSRTGAIVDGTDTFSGVFGVGAEPFYDNPVQPLPDPLTFPVPGTRAPAFFAGAFDGVDPADDDLFRARFAALGYQPLGSIIGEISGLARPNRGETERMQVQERFELTPGRVSVTPEPATWALVGAGLAAVAGVARRRRTA